MRRVALIVGFLIGSLLIASPAVAGGWAVTTVVEMPDTFVPGQTHEVVFEIRQHGTRLVTDLDDVAVVLTRTDGEREVLLFPAVAAGTQWRAGVVTPEAGEWEWRIRPGGFRAVEMGELRIAVPAVETVAIPAAVWIGSILAAIGALLMLRRRTPQPVAT
jgi:hypothetical protein